MNEIFTQQCNTIENDSTLPNDLVFETTERILSFDISKDEITKIIRSLDPNKAHWHDGISIRNYVLLQYQSLCSYFLNIA